MKRRPFILLLILLAFGLTASAQQYANDFENRYTWYPPWTNIAIAVDSSGVEPNYVCVCDSTMEYGLGMDFPVPDTMKGHNLNLHLEADYRFPDTLGHGEIVFTLIRDGQTLFWESYNLAHHANDSARWFHVDVDLNIPADHLEGSIVRTFLWKKSEQRIFIDNALLTLTPWVMKGFLPDSALSDDTLVTAPLLLLDQNSIPLTHPLGMAVEYLLDGDTISEFTLFSKQENSGYLAVSSIDSTYANSWQSDEGNPRHLLLASSFYKPCQLLRQSLVVPFVDSTMIVYRRNHKVDSVQFQDEYYLDREGFQVGKGNRSVVVYHQTDISSLQLDAVQRTAYFNLDYWRDHPMIHYPLSDSLEDHFEDVSYRQVQEGMRWMHTITLSMGYDIPDLPRIMTIPYGYESGIIFTEHADWTDIRTHRAVLFGSEKITKAKDAIGGFVSYGIPVTKSVFYNNPDQVTNEAVSRGTFKGLHCTIKTDREFEKLLRQLQRLDFDLCLHTPEQYTTTPDNLKEAMSFMRRNFHTVTWIDHGYNNGSMHNREDLVCDGLDPNSDCYAAGLWQSHGVKYLWNAYYEENRMERWCFDNNLMQPYPGFGDALPNRQITTIAGHDYYYGLSYYYRSLEPDFLTWCTPSTLEAVTDNDWDFYYSEQRLQTIVDNHDVHITHIYPAWVVPGRHFWTTDEDGTIVALPGMNRALERIAALRDGHKMLPMTIKTYLDYNVGLLQVYYESVDAEHIKIYNNNSEEVKGFTLLCPSPIHIEDNRYFEFQKSGDCYYVWFDLKPYDNVTIEIKKQP